MGAKRNVDNIYRDMIVFGNGLIPLTLAFTPSSRLALSGGLKRPESKPERFILSPPKGGLFKNFP